MAVKFLLASLAVGLWCGAAEADYCHQRAVQDFRADENDCSVFHMCVMGQLVTLNCSPGSVFDEGSHSCVPANSYYDTCSQRMAVKTRCAPGSRELVPHPTLCAQYYDCGATHAQNRIGWESQLRECPYPMVFHAESKRCVQSEAGICGERREPLDQCDYKVNECQGHSSCVPCEVRFPSCRGLADGKNAWGGRPGSPWYVVCHQQRVRSYEMCKQDGAVFIFDDQSGECVKKEEVISTPGSLQQHPQTLHHTGYAPQQPAQPTYQQPAYQPRPTYQNGYQSYQTGYQQGYRPQTGGYQAHAGVQPVSSNSARQQGTQQRSVQYVWLK
nr:hypothetical protein BaRGS_005976 [Batillaria attramentaria]